MLVVALGTAVTAILVPAIGLYLYRALLSSGGAIRGVIDAYTRLIFGQSEEQVALQRTNMVLGESTIATNDLAVADERLAIASGRSGGLAGLGAVKKVAPAVVGAGGSGLVGVAALGAALYVTARQTKALFEGKTWDPLHVQGATRTVEHGLHTGFDYDRHYAAHYADTARSHIAAGAEGLWHDVFGGGSSGTSIGSGRQRLHIVAHVYLDGKEVTRSVVKQTKATAARM